MPIPTNTTTSASTLLAITILASSAAAQTVFGTAIANAGAFVGSEITASASFSAAVTEFVTVTDNSPPMTITHQAFHTTAKHASKADRVASEDNTAASTTTITTTTRSATRDEQHGPQVSQIISEASKDVACGTLVWVILVASLGLL